VEAVPVVAKRRRVLAAQRKVAHTQVRLPVTVAMLKVVVPQPIPARLLGMQAMALPPVARPIQGQVLPAPHPVVLTLRLLPVLVQLLQAETRVQA
jgi:hypothetical protein